MKSSKRGEDPRHKTNNKQTISGINIGQHNRCCGISKWQDTVNALVTEKIPLTYGTAELEIDPSRPSLVTIFLNGWESSCLDLSDPGYLEFEYMQHFIQICNSLPSAPQKVIHLGGAGCAFARAIHAFYPHSEQLVVEYDEILATNVRSWFHLPRAPQIKIRVGEARETVKKILEYTSRFDVIVRDTFVGDSCPSHLQTRDFVEEVKSLLSPSGVYLVNTVDQPSSLPGGRTGAREFATIREVFPEVVAVADPAVWNGRRFGNLVIAASDTPFDASNLAREIRRLPLPCVLRNNLELEQFARGVQPYTDQGLS